ncbi:hypothetical protein LZG43_17985 [Streptomyces thermodiastaticus]|nr:hypothetical protein [Streptomyces thermodiastaticus]MCE7551819.1 hypothetical protein [Streptomyces thermodiastaticus]
MPTPYGTRGAMVFGAQELRVLRRALAVALHDRPASAKDVQDCLRLAEALDEAMREGDRLRAFLVADLARYRAALPGTAVGYCTLLRQALDDGYQPVADDLAALRALRGNPAAAALLRRLGVPKEPPASALAAPAPPAPRTAADVAAAAVPVVPASRSPLYAVRAPQEGLRGLTGPRCGLPGARGAQEGDETEKPAEKPAGKPAPKPAERPAPAQPRPAPKPGRRPIPTPGEVFPRRRPTPPAGDPHRQQRLAV